MQKSDQGRVILEDWPYGEGSLRRLRQFRGNRVSA